VVSLSVHILNQYHIPVITTVCIVLLHTLERILFWSQLLLKCIYTTYMYLNCQKIIFCLNYLFYCMLDKTFFVATTSPPLLLPFFEQNQNIDLLRDLTKDIHPLTKCCEYFTDPKKMLNHLVILEMIILSVIKYVVNISLLRKKNVIHSSLILEMIFINHLLMLIA